MAGSFHFPHDLQFSDNSNKEAYANGIKIFRELTQEVKQFYLDYEFFYIQYKHGLTLPMRPFGNQFSNKQVLEEKKGKLEPFLVAFDNFNLEIASKKRKFTIEHGVFMPGFTDNVRLSISELHSENNYLRFVFPPDRNTNIDRFVEIAHKVRFLINIFRYNYHNALQKKNDTCFFELPKDVTTNKVTRCGYSSC